MKHISRHFGAGLAAAILGMAMSGVALAEVSGSGGWSRATTPGAAVAVGYLVLTNDGDEERSLLKISSPVSDTITLHRSSVDSQGVARMWPLASLKVAPGESLRLEPSGVHVMFSDIKHAFKVGDKVPLTLQFDGFEKPFTIVLEVRPLVPEAPAAGHDHQH